MAPIRIGLIGLSTSSKATSWAASAHLPYLQSPQGRKSYEIVALCNSSVDSAKKSIEHFKLDPSTKAYDSAEELAQDPNVDLVVNVTGVERHYELVLPAVKAGKNVYTELPLASNMEQMKELYQTAKQKNVKTIFGMQGQTSAVTKALTDIIAEGKIGKVLNVTWTGCNAHGLFGEKPVPKGFESLMSRKTGANFMTVWFLHTFNHLIATFGELESYTSLLANQRPQVDVIDMGTKKIVDHIAKDTPDTILLQGRFKSGATVSYNMRGGDPFPGQKAVVWEIYGEKGAIRLTNDASGVDITHAGVDIQLLVFGKEPEKVELPNDELTDMPHPAQNVGKIYEAYARGQEGGEGGYPNWDQGFKMHELMEDMFTGSGF